MKKLIKISLLIAIMAVITTPTFGNTPSLTDEQKLLLSSNIRENDENFETFRSTLDVFQLAIFEDPQLNSWEKRKAFESSLTPVQEALMEANKVLEKSMKEDFRNSLYQDQREDLRATIKNSLDEEEIAVMEGKKVLREVMRGQQKLNKENS